jgi:DNA-directed RNA polymerase specialized sigma24 family protein
LALESAASPENQDRLNAAIERRIPNVSLTSCPLDRLPDSAGNPLEAIWDQEWRTTLLEAALAAVKARVDPSQWQIFDLYALKRWPVGDVVKALGVSAGRVYIARHRITLLLKKQIKALERG